MNFEKNCLSYWYPKLKETGVKVPRTVYFDMNVIDPEFNKAVRTMFHGNQPSKEELNALKNFVHALGVLTEKIGFPCFMRTGMTSHKHQWKETCYVENKENLLQQAQNIAEWSIMATTITTNDPKVHFEQDKGLPYNVWVIRELIPTEPMFTSFADMPITLEYRFYFKDNKYVCHHPYWPHEAFDTATKTAILDRVCGEVKQEEIDFLIEQTNKVAEKFDGWWSLDWLRSKDGTWFAIDMAVGEDSYHWKGCPQCPEK